MVVFRSSPLIRTFFTAQQSTRVAGTRASSRVWQQVSRRTYASGLEVKKTSDLPWLIGSVAFTVPAAAYLLSESPKPVPESHKDPEEPQLTEKQATTKSEEKEEMSAAEPVQVEKEPDEPQKASIPAELEKGEAKPEKGEADENESDDDGPATPSTEQSEDEGAKPN
ncbi:uncharacterized protein PADG_05703 [Paracoccidioides brasiliensis Pb18]|uniref:Uncharacterized protein n=2 Tax=Paracoccidioides brasiliensis TaxID=121759 RepID=C1GEL7_PARBD|nr:uncharacterized protein PADG_05703 [Paracoccidioides brasiliensis Pb18]EEH49624.2 hypothetical protein PADG_05703 [Paracoccidioides brasiliensis Pb18]ODH31680.1 hypothetical protein ACO22_03442 [Paracoccidioides brasiliensis]ODH53215.1 hypothetical protein GX48_00751 [Paracoccidioides brasiliensis]